VESDGWEVDATPPGGAPAGALAAEAIALLPGAAPTYRVFELCASALPAVLAGTASGEATLFSPATLGLWFDYFSNANPHYALNNALAAAALVRAVPPEATIVELGGGGGSAAEAALAALSANGKPPLRYHFTELHPAFLRRGTRVVQAVAPAGCTVTAARYDINADPTSQGMQLGQADAVVAVNTLHLAHHLVPTLASLRSLLRPGGALVLGELLRPTPLAGVHIELPFTLLEGYRNALSADGLRPRPGFMAADGWRRALLAAGFERVALLPAALSQCVELYPGFYCGAISAT
jgi:SAM-dependent methyltransferase